MATAELVKRTWDIPTDSSYWGTQTTDEQAARAADAFEIVMTEAARRIGVDLTCIQSPNGDAGHFLDDHDDHYMQTLGAFSEFAWQHDHVQAAAFDQQPVDAGIVIADYVRFGLARGATEQWAEQWTAAKAVQE